MRYHNYHKHDHFGNPWIPDTVTKPEEYCKRAVELGHTAVFTTNHGVTGNVFEWIGLCKQYNLQLIYGMEAYYVDDASEKDKSNKHLIVIAKNNDGVYQLNNIMSNAHENGFYYRPRIDRKDILSLDPEDFIITTACVGGIWENTELILAMHRRFGRNFFLEVQDHDLDIQRTANRRLIELSEEFGIPLIHGNDSHYIYPQDAEYRTIFLNGKRGKKTGDESAVEDDMILDYPDSDEIFKRYRAQGVLTRQQVEQALKSTLIFDECEPITIINDDIKLPSVSENPTQELKSIINEKWKEERKWIPKQDWPKYLDAIRYEVDIVEKTHMENYFLIDYNVVKLGQEKYGGRLTNTGRGSAPSFYITKLLGLTDIDRIAAPITLFPTRFMSIERILGTRSLPDKLHNEQNMVSIYTH